MARAVSFAGTALVAVALAVFALGLALQPLTWPGFTSVLTARLDVAEASGLTPERAEELAQAVRAFVADPAASELPETVDGRPAFDSSAVSHLADVRAVISGARLATGLLAGVLTVWLAVCMVRKAYSAISKGLRAGAAVTAAFVVIAILGAVADFQTIFAGFHALFFESGTWTFPQGALLIQLFPEAFWATAGAFWGLIVLAVAGAYWLAARAVARQAAERAGAAGTGA